MCKNDGSDTVCTSPKVGTMQMSIRSRADEEKPKPQNIGRLALMQRVQMAALWCWKRFFKGEVLLSGGLRERKSRFLLVDLLGMRAGSNTPYVFGKGQALSELEIRSKREGLEVILGGPGRATEGLKLRNDRTRASRTKVLWRLYSED